MSDQFINLTEDNLAQEHLCCIIRSKKPHPGVEAKRAWLAQRLREGHVFRKLDTKGVVFIEYAPLETAWAPVEGENYLYIYCLWVSGEFKGKGYGRHLMEYCLADAKSKGKSGVCSGLPHPNLFRTLCGAAGGHWRQPVHHPVLRGLRVSQAPSGEELLHRPLRPSYL